MAGGSLVSADGPRRCSWTPEVAATGSPLETLWKAFMDEARDSPALPRPLLRDDTAGEGSLIGLDAGLAEPDLDALDDDEDKDAYLPPAILETERGEVQSQAAYIDQLEGMLLGAGLSARPGAACSDVSASAAQGQTSVGLRHENRMLRAKCLMLQRQLQEAHARCRRAEKVNAQWREQHGSMRTRERESWRALQQALRKLERMGESEAHNHRLRDSLAKRSAELVRCGQRIAELELMCESLRDALGQAMSNLQPEALDALT